MATRYTYQDLGTPGIATHYIHGGSTPDPVTGAILTPIYQTATYAQEALNEHKGFTYSRASNPTVQVLEQKLATAEGAGYATCFASGMAAIATLILSCLSSGEHLVCSNVIYGGVVRLVEQLLAKFNLQVTFVDSADHESVAAAILANTRLILIETPANPTLKLSDIQAIATIARQHQIPLAVDNTFLTASLQQPLSLGADIVVYSTTKYIDGHNATVGGALVYNQLNWHEQFDFTRKTIGTIQAPFNAWLILQGLKTLDLRIKAHSQNALVVAQYLAQHPKITQLYYPGLASFPQYALACKQHQQHHGGIIAFEVNGGYYPAVTVINHTKLCVLAESLGSVETLITHPASMTHGPIPEEARHKLGISDGLIRLSVGLENVQDIINDLEQALALIK